MTETSVDLAACIKNKSMSAVLMARYGCHKEVHVLPMTRGEYNNVRGWTIPEDENPDDAGYLVVYNRGTYDEYVSWSPKHVFDDGYHPLDGCNDNGNSEPAFITRMRAELKQLDERTLGLANGLHFAKTKTHHDLMVEQLDVMKRYQQILRKRFSDLGFEV